MMILIMRWAQRARSRAAGVCLAAACCFTLLAAAADEPLLQGRVTNTHGLPVAGLALTLGEASAETDADGRYHLPVAQTAADLTVSWQGRVLARTRVAAGATRYDIRLEAMPVVTAEMSVVSTRTDSLAEANLGESVLRRLPAEVTGDVLRTVPGVGAVRRGPVGLDPVVRGLRETEVGTYLDGTRLFPGGPGRMDSGLSHLDPGTIERVQVVKGPYALTWGAGNMSAVRVESFDTRRVRDNGGSLSAGYRGNSEGYHVAPSAHGRQGALGWWVHGVTRASGDYEDGNGQTVQGDMTSQEARAKLSYATSGGHVLVSAGYQHQDDIDYPGRLLNADYFHTRNLSVGYATRGGRTGLFQGFSANLYVNDVDHGMNNTGKPTALDNPNRTPPFALAIDVNSGITVTGLRAAVDLAGADWTWSLGLDGYRARRDALRTIARAETGMVIAQDRMWPDAVIRVLGVFAEGERPVGDAGRLTAAVRLDDVSADAGAVTPFFAEHAGTETAAGETPWSAAATYHHRLTDTWTLAGGLGSVARTADANERYADRIPSSKAQTSAEFLGNPDLKAERSTQVDLWLEGSGTRWSFNLNAFARRIDDYITLEATDLPPKLPLSPPVVYRYVNGEASFVGAETSLQVALTDRWQVGLGAAWLRGEDRLLDEPGFGITPLTLEGRLAYLIGTRHRVALHVRDVGDQDRVSTSRAETPTPGYTVVDLQTDWRLGARTALGVGLTNLTDEAFAEHLNAKNPFTGARVTEPGRAAYLNLHHRF